MTPHGIVSRATFADAHELDQSLRPEDRRELEDISGRPALQNLLLGVLVGKPSLAIRSLDGELAGILGVAPVGLQHGAVAFAGTPVIEQRSTAFLRGSRDVLDAISRDYDTLFNVCDARNEVHHRWLRWLGFTFIRKIDHYGAAQVPVYEFARISPCATS